MYRIRKRFRVEMAHQLSSAASACCTDSIHGHSYKIDVVLRSHLLNDSGMVLDFGALKELAGKIIDDFDHAILLPQSLVDQYGESLQKVSKKVINFGSANPTAEEMAAFLYAQIQSRLRHLEDVEVDLVRVHETDTGWAEYSRD